MLSFRFKVAWLLIALPLVACQQGDPAEPLEFSRCWLEGLATEARCKTVEVLEDRQDPEGRRIGLRVAVIPARNRNVEPDPLFLLAGGPGLAATESLPPIAAMLSEVRRERDLVLVDQRGTGGSNPLECLPDTLDEEEPDALSEIPDWSPASIFATDVFERCLSTLEADLRFYTTPIAMDDLDEVRAALGYERINIWGGSYGTRAALVYLRQYPERVRTIVLDGVHPLDNRHPLLCAQNMQSALDLMLRRCADDDDCAKVFPDLDKTLEELLSSLEEPLTVTVPHPRSGIPQEVVMTRDGFTMALGHLLYIPRFVSLMPWTITQAARGDFSPLSAQFLAFSADLTGYAGKQLAVGCSEDVALISEEDVEQHSRDSVFGEALTRAFMDACAIWPRAELPEGYHDPVTSDAPVLILSGALDPVTPPSWGDDVAEGLPNSRHLVAPGAGHGVVVVPCVPGLIADFLDAGSASNLDFACAEDYPPTDFFLDFAREFQ